MIRSAQRGGKLIGEVEVSAASEGTALPLDLIFDENQ
jgi:hypothetical protein